MEKRVIVLMGPAGAGKSSVASYLKEKWMIPQVITHTTRLKRLGEKDGVDYYFESPDSFERNHYLERVTYAGNQYGSSVEGLQKGFAKSSFLSIVLDTKGAETYLKELGAKAWLWYVTVSDVNVLEKRLYKRGDAAAAIQERLASSEFKRDLKIPETLKGKVTVVNNDDWQQTKRLIDRLIEGAKSN